VTLARILILCAGVFAAQTLHAETTGNGNVGEITRTLHAGDSLEAVLDALNGRGHRVVYSSALVLPGMKLAAAPRAKEVGRLLEEVLAPFKLRAVRAEGGSAAGGRDHRDDRRHREPLRTGDRGRGRNVSRSAGRRADAASRGRCGAHAEDPARRVRR
jgi:hypothetical protein